MIETQNREKYFNVFASCIPVQGANRSIIMDLQRGGHIYIPNSLHDFLPNFKEKKLSDLLNEFNTDAETIESYVEYLLSYEVGFFTDNPENFPAIDMTFYSPMEILDAIIELSPENMHYLKEVFKELSLLGCQNLELRSFDALPLKELEYIISLGENTRLRSINVITRYDKEISKSEWTKFISDHTLVDHLIIHSSINDEETEIKGFKYIERQINNSSSCGCNINSFSTINLMFTTESMHFNNCLHRKVSIDVQGNIVNCLNLKNDIQGNIKTHLITEIIRGSEFQKLWDINKDKIKTCQDCEYRYMCSDCRAHISGVYDKPKHCNYDPYTNTYHDDY
jgi:SPASM domain peptide maturase of grasp-with-spasm system